MALAHRSLTGCLHYHSESSRRFMAALSEGMAISGDRGTVSSGFSGADFYAVWGRRPHPPEGERLYLEAGYINGAGSYLEQRLRFVSTEWGGLGNAGCPIGHCPPDRWDSLGIELKPWKRQVRARPRLLVLDQHSGDAACNPSAVKAALIGSGGFEVRRRPHPLEGNTVPLSVDLDWADCALTWCSTSAVEAVIAGVPTVTLSPDAVAAPVCVDSLSRLSEARKPREEWARTLAYRQWTEDELKSGEAWERLRCYALSRQSRGAVA